MNIKTYFIDEKVASILFHTSDEKKVEEILSWVTDMQLRLHDEVMMQHFLEKGIPQTEVEDYLNGKPVDEAKFKLHAESKELEDKTLENINAFLKLVVDNRMRELDDSYRSELESYMIEKQAEIDSLEFATKEFNRQIEKSGELVKSLGLSSEEVKKMVDDALSEAYRSFEDSEDQPQVEANISSLPQSPNNPPVPPTT